MRIACIGTRVVPERFRALLMDIGENLVTRGYIISTGNARGADNLFALGGNRVDPTKVELHLPWPGYNQEQIVPGNIVQVDGDNPQDRALVASLHPNWSNLSRGVRALHTRNVAIVRGCGLVIALPDWGKPGGGGTGLGIQLAQHLNIPVLDLTKDEDLQRVLARLAGGYNQLGPSNTFK